MFAFLKETKQESTDSKPESALKPESKETKPSSAAPQIIPIGSLAVKRNKQPETNKQTSTSTLDDHISRAVKEADSKLSGGYMGGAIPGQTLSHQDFVTDMPQPPIPSNGGRNSNGISDFGTRRLDTPPLGFTPQARSHWVPVSQFPNRLDGRRMKYDDIPEDASTDSDDTDDLKGGAYRPKTARRRDKEYAKAYKARKEKARHRAMEARSAQNSAYRLSRGLLQPGHPLLEDHPALGVSQPTWLGSEPMYPYGSDYDRIRPEGYDARHRYRDMMFDYIPRRPFRPSWRH